MLLNIRLYNQRLVGGSFTSPGDVVSWMGAIQAQNYEMAKWGVALRARGMNGRCVEETVDRGEIIRTHILRPTWHFVTAEDVHWMRALTSARVKAAYISYGRERGFDGKTVTKTNKLVEGILDKEPHLTRLEIAERLERGGLTLQDPRGITFIMEMAEQDGVVCSGRVRDGKQTYALLHQRAPLTTTFGKEESLEKLARRFFSSHGPATLQDFVWWSGLLQSDARRGIECIQDDFICEKFNDTPYWMANGLQSPPPDSFLLLPAFDEFVVSYRDRKEISDEKHYRKFITRTGVFSPTIMLNGRVAGTWKKQVRKNKTEATLDFFEEKHKEKAPLFEEQRGMYSDFF